MLSATGLHRRFRRRVVLHDLTLRVEPGEIVGLLGPNGAGKTTTFRILAGLLRPHSGSVTLGGEDITRWPLWRRARAGLGYLPQQPTVFRRLSVQQNVELGLSRRGLSIAETHQLAQNLLERFGLIELASARGGTLSGGERRRVEIIRALAAAPKILLVDEPFAGLDPVATTRISAHLRTLAQDGVGVLLTDHDARQALETCDRIYILSGGVLIRTGTSAEVAMDPSVRALYLGHHFDALMAEKNRDPGAKGPDSHGA